MTIGAGKYKICSVSQQAGNLVGWEEGPLWSEVQSHSRGQIPSFSGDLRLSCKGLLLIGGGPPTS